MNIHLLARRLARQQTPEIVHRSIPVEIVAGNSPPKLTGCSYHWTTRGGTPVRHPSAYSRKGWSNLVYHHSTLCVRVGVDWLSTRIPEYASRLNVGSGI